MFKNIKDISDEIKRRSEKVVFFSSLEYNLRASPYIQNISSENRQRIFYPFKNVEKVEDKPDHPASILECKFL